MVRIALLLFLAQAQQPIPLEEMYEQAIALMEAEGWDNAIEKLEAIREEEPSHVPTLFNLAVCLSETDRVDGALDLYRHVLELDPTLFEAQMNLAILLHESGASEAAVEEFARAAALAPDDPVPGDLMPFVWVPRGSPPGLKFRWWASWLCRTASSFGARSASSTFYQSDLRPRHLPLCQPAREAARRGGDDPSRYAGRRHA